MHHARSIHRLMRAWAMKVLSCYGVLIDKKGKAERVEIQQSSGLFCIDDSVREEVIWALFKPNIENGRPTPAFAIVYINFTLNK